MSELVVQIRGLLPRAEDDSRPRLCGNVFAATGQLFAKMRDEGLIRACDRFEQRVDAEDGDYPRQIVGEDVEAHFDTDPFQPSGQEVRCSHPGLDGSSG
jgi:hypothetical protein